MANEKYAESHGVRVVLSYFGAKTGLVFRQRGDLDEFLLKIFVKKLTYLWRRLSCIGLAVEHRFRAI